MPSTVWPTPTVLVGILVVVFIFAFWARDFLKKDKRLKDKVWKLESKIRKFQDAYDKGWVDSRDQARLSKVITGWEKELAASEIEYERREDKKARKELAKLFKRAPY